MIDRTIVASFAIAGAFWLTFVVVSWKIPSVFMIAIGAAYIVAGSLLMAVSNISWTVKVPLLWAVAISSLIGFFSLTTSNHSAGDLLTPGLLVGTLAYWLWLGSGLLGVRLLRRH